MQVTLTISNFCGFAEIVLDVKAFRLRVFGVGVNAVRDQDALVGDAGVSQVLGLCRTLVTETVRTVSIPSSIRRIDILPQEHDSFAFEKLKVRVGVVVAMDRMSKDTSRRFSPSRTYIFADGMLYGGRDVRPVLLSMSARWFICSRLAGVGTPSGPTPRDDSDAHPQH